MSWFRKKDTSGTWELHPCILPRDLGLTNEDVVWRCHCGRRWKYLGFSQELHLDGRRDYYNWEEEDADMGPAIEKLEDLANNGG